MLCFCLFGLASSVIQAASDSPPRHLRGNSRYLPSQSKRQCSLKALIAKEHDNPQAHGVVGERMLGVIGKQLAKRALVAAVRVRPTTQDTNTSTPGSKTTEAVRKPPHQVAATTHSTAVAKFVAQTAVQHRSSRGGGLDRLSSGNPHTTSRGAQKHQMVPSNAANGLNPTVQDCDVTHCEREWYVCQDTVENSSLDCRVHLQYVYCEQ